MNTDPMIHTASGSRRPARTGSARATQKLSFTSAGATHTGLVRDNNEDRFLVAALSEAGARGSAPPGYLLAVADGVGGARGGEVASALAIETLEQSLPTLRSLALAPSPSPSRILHELEALVRRADQRIVDEASHRESCKGMGTTLTAAVLLGRSLLVAHVGDSRCYRLRDRTLRRLTDDQTITADLVRRGLLTDQAAQEHRYRHVLTDFAGGGASRLHVATRESTLSDGDLVLLSTDGLTEMVPEHEIASLLAFSETPEAACTQLVARANAHGGHDNVTTVVARCALAA